MFEICSARLSLGQWAPLCACDELLLPFAADFSIVSTVSQNGRPLEGLLIVLCAFESWGGLLGALTASFGGHSMA